MCDPRMFWNVHILFFFLFFDSVSDLFRLEILVYSCHIKANLHNPNSAKNFGES